MAAHRAVLIRASGGALGGRKGPRQALVMGTGVQTVRRSDWTERPSVLDSFLSVMAPPAEVPDTQAPEWNVSPAFVPELPAEPEATPVSGLEEQAAYEIPAEPHTVSDEPKQLSAGADSSFRSVEPDPDWHYLRHRCVLCGRDRYGEQNPWTSPSWITEQGWVICRTCYSVHRGTVGALAEYQPGGWVVPYDFIERNLRTLPRHRTGLFVDCSLVGGMQKPCTRLFSQSLRIQELYEMPSLQAEDITCYTCIETAYDAEWVMQLLLYHLAEHGVLRINLLLSPFLSSPKQVGRWLESHHIDVHHFPSKRGMEEMLERLGLEVLVRMRTVNLPLATGFELPNCMKGFILAPWNAVRVARMGLESMMNFGFGEELVLSRKHASPQAELLLYPPRPFGKVM
jgi:hypothetical protein